MLFSWLRSRRRRKLLAQPFPIRWESFLKQNVFHYLLLSSAEQSRLRDLLRLIVEEKNWVGRDGLLVTEEMKVTIAAQAALLLLNRDESDFDNVSLIVIHPSTFQSPREEDDWEDDGLSEIPVSGQAIYRGPVILAWDEVLPEGSRPDAGMNVVIHEFAHQLDYLENVSEGKPHLDNSALESRWRYIMTVAFEDHRRQVAGGGEHFFSENAAENEAEFFAYTSEAFFCRPVETREVAPDVYEMLSAFYRLDPARWFEEQKPDKSSISR